MYTPPHTRALCAMLGLAMLRLTAGAILDATTGFVREPIVMYAAQTPLAWFGHEALALHVVSVSVGEPGVMMRLALDFHTTELFLFGQAGERSRSSIACANDTIAFSARHRFWVPVTFATCYSSTANTWVHTAPPDTPTVRAYADHYARSGNAGASLPYLVDGILGLGAGHVLARVAPVVMWQVSRYTGGVLVLAADTVAETTHADAAITCGTHAGAQAAMAAYVAATRTSDATSVHLSMIRALYDAPGPTVRPFCAATVYARAVPGPAARRLTAVDIGPATHMTWLPSAPWAGLLLGPLDPATPGTRSASRMQLAVDDRATLVVDRVMTSRPADYMAADVSTSYPTARLQLGFVPATAGVAPWALLGLGAAQDAVVVQDCRALPATSAGDADARCATYMWVGPATADKTTINVVFSMLLLVMTQVLRVDGRAARPSAHVAAVAAHMLAWVALLVNIGRGQVVMRFALARGVLPDADLATMPPIMFWVLVYSAGASLLTVADLVWTTHTPTGPARHATHVIMTRHAVGLGLFATLLDVHADVPSALLCIVLGVFLIYGQLAPVLQLPRGSVLPYMPAYLRYIAVHGIVVCFVAALGVFPVAWRALALHYSYHRAMGLISTLGVIGATLNIAMRTPRKALRA
jgi:hypothetical protein